jgi:DNA-binding NtrC family response regulator
MAAERGTLFLDHIDALSPRAQRQLLAFVTERTGATTAIDRRWGGRLICGSRRDLDGLANEGRFLLPLLDCLDKARVSLDEVCQGGAA